MEMNILIPTDLIMDGVKPLIDQGANILRCPSGEDGLIEGIKDADVVLARTEYYTRKVLESAPRLKIIARYGVGVEKIDLKAAEDLGIWVSNVPTALSNAVAEHVVMLILMASRNVRYSTRLLEKGDFSARFTLGHEIAGKTLGLIGFGNIGRSVATKCINGLGMKVLFYDPYVKSTSIEGACPASIDDLLASSDIVSLHLPLVEDTKGFADKAFFSKMKAGAIFINAARGGEMVEDDLVDALLSGKLYAAGLDCYSTEPLPISSKLYQLDNVIMTPHNASATYESLTRCSYEMGKNVWDVMIDDKAPRNAVNHPLNPRKGR